MGWRWVWGAKDDRGAAPTRWVGESAVTSSGCSVSRSDSSRSSPVVLGVGEFGLVEDVVAVVRVVQRLAQAFRPRRCGLEIVSHAPILPDSGGLQPSPAEEGDDFRHDQAGGDDDGPELRKCLEKSG